MHSERMFGLTASVESGCLFFREQALYNEFENFVLLEDKIMSEEVNFLSGNMHSVVLDGSVHF